MDKLPSSFKRVVLVLTIVASGALVLGLAVSPGQFRQALFLVGMTSMGVFSLVQVALGIRHKVILGPTWSYSARDENPTFYWMAMVEHACVGSLFGLMPLAAIFKTALAWLSNTIG